MNIEEVRERARTSPEWLFVELITRLEAAEAKIVELSKPKPRGRPKRVKDGA